MPLDETSALIQKTEPPKVVGPLAAPRILPSIVEAFPSNLESIEPMRRKRATRPKAGREQIELDLHAAAEGEAGEGSSPASLIAEAQPQTEVAPVAEKNAIPVQATQLQDTESQKTKARTRRTKPSELAEPVETPQTEIQAIPISDTDSLIAASDIVKPSKAIPAKRTRHQAAAQLPRSERWKRRLHPAAW
ncbi:hypothetical protein [Microvirga yunnanensis]|uniref:hypothetical protein n=1 Tax=Microvirga yunnanensis TaxID=2953740 RepID=UPI0021C8F462|nr:hypothetical protein [Microvirga sp. HBU65207]